MRVLIFFLALERFQRFSDTRRRQAQQAGSILPSYANRVPLRVVAVYANWTWLVIPYFLAAGSDAILLLNGSPAFLRRSKLMGAGIG